MHVSRSVSGLVVVAAMLGCNASNDHSLQGQWQVSGAEVSGYFLQMTRTGQSVSGQLYLESNDLPQAAFTGTKANGSVTLSFGFSVCEINGTSIVGNCPPTGTFTGHFHGANTVEGVAIGQSLTLTRLPSDIVLPN
jgi:hypothetical protein